MHPSHKWLTQHLYNDMGNDNCDGNSSAPTPSIPCIKFVANVWPVAIAINPVFSPFIRFYVAVARIYFNFGALLRIFFPPKTGGIEHLSALFLWHHEKKRSRQANFCNVLLIFIFFEISFNTVSFTLITKLRAASVEDAEKSIAIKSNECGARLSSYLN